MASEKVKFQKPDPSEYHEFYEGYISGVTEHNFWNELTTQPEQLRNLFAGVSHEQETLLQEPYTWTFRQVLGHMIDCERIFSTRLLRIATGDETPIPGIDQNQYVSGLDYESVSLSDLLEEFGLLRQANILLANRLTKENLSQVGVASNNPASARANLYILVGHAVHHQKILEHRVAQLPAN